jgi:predicted transcriptional regulator YdeE
MYLGCKVAAGTPVPEGMKSVAITGGDYQKFQAKGDLTKGAVVEAWHRIWQADLNRAYTTDFEAYDPQYTDPTQGVVDIYIALK